MNITKNVFHISPSKESIIDPPDQVFTDPSFRFLLTVGGTLVADENKFNRFCAFIGETSDAFYVVENLGATQTCRTVPFA